MEQNLPPPSTLLHRSYSKTKDSPNDSERLRLDIRFDDTIRMARIMLRINDSIQENSEYMTSASESEEALRSRA